MCLYPTYILNPRYKPNKKNNYNPPICDDYRKLYVPIGCGVCRECLKRKSSEWKVRLFEEVKKNKEKVWFVTYTFNEDALNEFSNKSHGDINGAAKLAVRKWYERYRLKYKISIRHFLITERGSDGTERLHLHGLVWGSREMAESWGFGHVYLGEYVNQKTINYIVKYISKEDKAHKDFRGKIFASKGIGNSNLDRYARKNDRYKLPNGNEVAIPIYLRNKLFTEEEREKKWIESLEKQERWVDGICYDISTKKGEDEFWNAILSARKRAEILGYEKPTKKRYKNSIDNFGNLNK